MVLCCTNVDGTNKLPPLLIGKSQNPRSFGNGGGAAHGLDYEGSGKGWMNNDIFGRWLHRVDLYIGSNTGRNILQLIDNSSAHGNVTN